MANIEDIQAELDRCKEDYQILQAVYKRDLAKARLEVQRIFAENLRGPCEIMQMMVSEALENPGKPQALVNKWNQLDHTLWGMINGSSGEYPVNGEA